MLSDLTSLFKDSHKKHFEYLNNLDGDAQRIASSIAIKYEADFASIFDLSEYVFKEHIELLNENPLICRKFESPNHSFNEPKVVSYLFLRGSNPFAEFIVETEHGKASSISIKFDKNDFSEVKEVVVSLNVDKFTYGREEVCLYDESRKWAEAARLLKIVEKELPDVFSNVENGIKTYIDRHFSVPEEAVKSDSDISNGGL